jgi:hypothetical protein
MSVRNNTFTYAQILNQSRNFIDKSCNGTYMRKYEMETGVLRYSIIAC